MQANRKAAPSQTPRPARQSAQLPKNWPPHLPYLKLPVYSKKLTADAVGVLVLPKADLPVGELPRHVTAPYANVKITPITDAAHPANGQNGLFATQNLPPGAFILSYLGYVHDQAETDDTSDYDLSLDRHHGLSVDASSMGNEARFINDYRGVADAPNAEFKDTYVALPNAKFEKRVGIFVRAGKSPKNLRGISKGQEILISYGKGFWNERIPTQPQ